MKVGFIGTGSMGSILIESLIQTQAVEPAHIIASNRTASKAERLAENYPGLRVARSNIEVVEGSEIVFICVKPSEFKSVLDEIQQSALPSHIVVSITSPVLIKHLESRLSSKVAKVIPSITNYVMSGASLCIYGKRMTEQDIVRLETLLSRISTPVRISEQHTRISSDLTSCGPAFIAFFLQKFIDAAVAEIGIPHDQALKLASEMALGTGKLLTSGGFTPESLQQRVCVPGGITAEALRVLEHKLEGVFNLVIQTTHAKYNEDVEKVEYSLCSPKI